MNKKAIEISINFLIIIVVSIVILSLGIYLVNKIFFGIAPKITELDQQTEDRIAATLSADKPVSIPFNNKEIERKETRPVGVGVLNVLNQPAQFQIKVISNQESVSPESDVTATYIENIFDLDENERQVETVLIAVPKRADPSITYVFDVRVEYNSGAGWDEYQTKKIYVTVV